ncbi:MAG: tetratricopeptide repeat protein [Thermoflexibacteraceae bacterium]
MKNYWYPLSIGLISCLLYANTFQHGYVLDDGTTIQYNRFVQEGWAGIPKIFSSDFWQGFERNESELPYYRPLSTATFAAEHALWGQNPMYSHIIQVGLFAVLTVLLYYFTYLLTTQPLLAFFAALLFAVHPLHTEVVANLKSRDELLGMLGAILALWAFVKALKNPSHKILWYGIGVTSYFLALLSKETPLTLIVFFPFIALHQTIDKNSHWKENIKKSILATLPFFVPILLFFALRQIVLGNAFQSHPPTYMSDYLYYEPSALARFATRVYVLGKYLWLCLFPAKLTIAYFYDDVPTVQLWSYQFWVSALSYGGIAYYLFRQWQQEGWLAVKNLAVLGLLFYLIALFLFSNLLVSINIVMAERFAFMPSWGICWVLAAIAFELWTNRQLFLQAQNILFVKVFGFILITLFVSKTFVRNKDWKSNETLMFRDVETAPESIALNQFVGNEYIEKFNQTGNTLFLSQAIPFYHKSLQRFPNNPQVLSNMGYVYTNLGQSQQAIPYYEKSLQLHPQNALLRIRLSGAYYNVGKYEEALNILQNVATDLYQNYLFLQLGRVYNALRSPQNAIQYLQQGLQLNLSANDYYLYHKELAQSFMALQQYDKARQALQQVLQIAPNDAEAQKQLQELQGK